MTQRVPFPFISGSIDDRSRREIERNFQYVTDQLVAAATTGYDGMVDPLATADNPSTLIFKTIYSAISYLYNTKNLRSISIGVISRDGATITETGALAGINNASIRVGVVGWQGSNIAGSHSVVWNLATFTLTGTGSSLNVTGLTLKSGNTTGSTFVLTTFNAAWCQVGDGQTQRWHNSGTYIECNYTGTADGIFYNCQCNFGSGTQTGGATQLVVIGGYIQGNGGNTLTLGHDNIYINSAFLGNSGGSSPPNILSIPSAHGVTVISQLWSADATGLSSVPCAVTIGSGVLRNCHIEGRFAWLLVPALAAPLSGNCTIRADLFANLGATGGADITGPAQVELNYTGVLAAAAGAAIVLRGFGINGSVTFTNIESPGAFTLLKCIGMKRSVLTYASKRDSTSSGTGTVPYNIDATSANNVIIAEVDAFGGAPVNSSASTLIITDAGVPSAPSGPAGGSLAGSYPNPTLSLTGVSAGQYGSTPLLEAALTISTEGRVTAVTQAREHSAAFMFGSY